MQDEGGCRSWRQFRYRRLEGLDPLRAFGAPGRILTVGCLQFGQGLA